MHHLTYVRRNRKHWALSQDDLAQLLGISQSAASRLESGETAPDLSIAFALQVVFNRSPRALFKGIYLKVEEEVMAAAARMDHELRDRTDSASRRKQQLLESMVVRSTPSDDAI
jgi:transcriptional regulator with XRE-family HTH domain